MRVRTTTMRARSQTDTDTRSLAVSSAGRWGRSPPSQSTTTPVTPSHSTTTPQENNEPREEDTASGLLMSQSTRTYDGMETRSCKCCYAAS